MESPVLLVVDDEEMIRKALTRTLRKEGYTVLTASGPEEGLEVLRHHHVDMVISDHLMPKMTGLEFLKLVHDRHPDVGRIMLTGHADMETAVRAINEGEIYRFLTKPWDDVELKVVLHLALEHIKLETENRRLLAMLRLQSQYIRDLEVKHPGIMTVRRDADGAVLLTDEEIGLLR